MDQSFPTRAPDIGAAAARLRSWVPPDWALLASLRDAEAGCHVLVHRRHGAILLDLAPGGTPQAETRLGRSLAMAGLGPGQQARLPFWYVQLEVAQLPRFAALLREALSTAPHRDSPANGAWIPTLRAALSADPAWLVEAPPPAPPKAAPPGPRAPSTVRLRRGALVVLGLGVTFVLGLMLGQRATPLAPAEPPAAEAEASVATPTLPPAVITDGADIAGAEASELAAAPPADEPPPIPEAPPAVAAVPDDPQAEEALPPPPAVVARPRAAPRPPRPNPDRRCAEAQFRWQQGGRLSWAEMAYVREGCSTGTSR